MFGFIPHQVKKGHCRASNCTNVTFLRLVWLCPVCYRTLTLVLPGVSWELDTGEITPARPDFEIRVVIVSKNSSLPLIITKYTLYCVNSVLIVCLYVTNCAFLGTILQVCMLLYSLKYNADQKVVPNNSFGPGRCQLSGVSENKQNSLLVQQEQIWSCWRI